MTEDQASKHSSPTTATNSAGYPVFVRADGIRLSAEDGRTYLDFASGFQSANVGIVQQAVTEHLRAHFQGDAESRFVDDLLRILPTGLTHIHPTRDGSEATEVSLSACMRYTEAKTFLAFKGGYHGATLGALAVSEAHRGQDLVEVSAPNAEFIDYPLNDDRTAAAVASAVRAITERSPGAPALAGVIVEPIQAKAGLRVPPQTFLPTLARAARSTGTPLIIDESFTGLGRTGHAFACEISGVCPDLLLLGNGMGSGLPGGLVAGTEAILSTFPPNPNRLHPVTAAACSSALRHALDNDVWSRPVSIESWFETHRHRVENHALVRRFRGVGAMYGIEIEPVDGLSPAELAQRVRMATLGEGLLTWECGVDEVVIGLIPPLVVEQKDVDDACAMALAALDSITARIGG